MRERRESGEKQAEKGDPEEQCGRGENTRRKRDQTEEPGAQLPQDEFQG